MPGPEPPAAAPGRRPSWPRVALVAAAYAVGVLAFTWPLPLALADHLALARGSDVWPHIWNFGWARIALLQIGHSPYSTHSIFYPTGVPLVYHALNIFTATLSIPLQLLFGLVPAFNGMMLANLLAAALAAYWLARVLNLAPGPAFLCGALFAFSPAVGAAFAQGQAELVSVFWLPLYAGLLLRGAGLRALGLPAGSRWYLLGAGLALVGSALAIWYWFVSLLVFTAVYAILELWSVSRGSGGRAAAGALVARLAVVGGLALLLLSPLLVVMAQEQLASGADVTIGRSGTTDAVTFNGSQDLLALLRPAPGRIDIARENLHGAYLGVGWTVIALAGAALALGRRRALLLWSLAALALLALALGPALVINGQSDGAQAALCGHSQAAGRRRDAGAHPLRYAARAVPGHARGHGVRGAAGARFPAGGAASP